MKQSSKRLISLGVAVLFVVGALVILFDLVQPEYANIEAAKAQAAGEQAFLDSETKAVAQAQTLLATYQKQQGNQNVSLAMPSSEDQAGALAQIYGIAQNTGLTVTTVGVGSPSIQAQAAGAVKVLSKPIGSVSFQITAAGSYESMINFLTEVETNVRLFDLKSISLSQGQGSTATVVKDLFNYSITLTSYYQTN